MIKGKSTKREYWLGIRGVYMIWHGQWSDPELKYKNHICNYYDIEDSMFQYMKERIADGEDWGDPNNDKDFADFCRAHADYIKSDIIDFSEAMNENVKVSRKNRKINESGDTERGQYMVGRLHRRSAERSTQDDSYRRRHISDEFDNLYKHNKGDWFAYDRGYEDEGIDIPSLKGRAIRTNYNMFNMKDMDKVGKMFINFIEDNPSILQLIVDYMSGNQNGKKGSSALGEIIPDFEEEVLGYEVNANERKAIERAFNEWWYYVEAQLTPEEYYDIDESYRPRKNRKINESFEDSEEEWDDYKNVNYIFQLSRMVMFNVSYTRLMGNKQPHFATSAQVFCKNKKGITRGGQCQSDVLKDFPLAYEFWQKWDNKHLHRLDVEKYEELLSDIEELKEEYNWDYTKSDSFPWYREVELSKQKPKRRMFTPRGVKQ